MAPEIFRRSSCRAGPCKRVEDDFIWPAQEFDHLGCQRDRPASRMGRKAGVSARSEEHTSELQSLMRISYAVFCLKQKPTRSRPSGSGSLAYRDMNIFTSRHNEVFNLRA